MTLSKNTQYLDTQQMTVSIKILMVMVSITALGIKHSL